MIKNKKLLIGLVCLAFCVCCAIFGIGFNRKNIMVAKADTISEATVKTTSATTAKSISLASAETSEEPIMDEPEEISDITDEEYIETEEPEEEIIEDDNAEDSETYAIANESVFVELTLNWEDDNGTSHPLRGVYVIAIKGGFSDEGKTNNDGQVTLEFPFANATTLIVTVYTAEDLTNNSNLRVVDSSGNPHGRSFFETIDVSAGGTYAFTETIRMNSNAGQAFQVFQAVLTARDFAAKMMGSMPSPVTVQYPSDGFYYLRSTTTINITQQEGDDDYPMSYASWDAIMHEYGHHLSYELGTIDTISSGYDHSSNVSHAEKYGKKIGIALAWKEAWPTVFALVAQQYYTTEEVLLTDIQWVGDTYYTDCDGLNYNVNDPQIYLGEACERSIMAVLWDLFDDDVEANDTIALGYQGFWNATTKSGITTFSAFIENFYNIHPELIYEIGANLSYYQMASFDLTVEDVSLDTLLPKMSWQRGGGSIYYQNNSFILYIYDANNKLLFVKSIKAPAYTLSLAEWCQVLNAEGDYFYFCVSAQNSYPTAVTEYISSKIKVQKPYNEISENINVFTLGLNRHIRIISGETEWLFKFVAPTSGTFTFYTEGGCDTYGEAYSQIYEYWNRLLASDDDSGGSKNFKITLNLQQNQCVYIRVKTNVFWLHYIMRVKQE